MVPKIVTVQFDYNSDDYKRLLDVFLYSIRKNTPYEVDVLTLEAPDRDGQSRSFDSNTAKLDAWVNYFKDKQGQYVLMDCDMLVLKPFHEVFEREFDIGYTYRGRPPFNGGVVYVNVNKYSLKLLRDWRDVNKKMYKDWGFHREYRTKYTGMNQAAFGYLLENNPDCNIEAFPCRIYNACDNHWRTLSDRAKVIHYKSELRRASLGHKFAPWLDKLILLWRQYEKESRQQSLSAHKQERQISGSR